MTNPQAISYLDKLRDEMAAHPDNSMLCTVGEILTVYASDHPTAIGALVAEGKTLDGAISAMRKVAEKKRNGVNMVALDMGEGMKAVFGYFEIPYDARGITRAAFALMDADQTPISTTLAHTRATADLDLDALLGL